MATFPTYVKTVWNQTTEQVNPVVIRSEMERGVPKQRRQSTNPMANLSLTLVFGHKKRIEDFESWFYNDIGAGALFFDFTHPRTGETIQARIVGGQLGQVTPLGLYRERYTMPLELEYLKVL